MSGRMRPILGKSGGGQTNSITGIVQSILGLCIIGGLFWFVAHELMVHVDQYPRLAAAYPFLGVLTLMACLPFLFYLGFSSEFHHLTPLNPSDYIFLLRRVISAAASQNKNSGKIKAKDL